MKTQTMNTQAAPVGANAPVKVRVKTPKVNNTKKLQDLRNQGFRYKVRHFRSHLSPQGIVYLTKEQANIVSQFVPLILQSRGGFTELTVLKGKQVFRATSTCHNNDNFCYALGLKFCLDRVMEENK